MKDGQMEDPHERIDKLIYINEENIYIDDVKVTFEKGMLKNKRITHFNL